MQRENREHYAAQLSGRSAEGRGQIALRSADNRDLALWMQMASHLLCAYNTLHINTGEGALCGAGDRELTAVQGTGSIPQCRGQENCAAQRDRDFSVLFDSHSN